MGKLTRLSPVTSGFDYGLSLDEYSDKYSQCLKFERDEGVLTVRMHTNDGPLVNTHDVHHALGQAWIDIGRDPLNEVVILAGTDGEFVTIPKHDMASLTADDIYQISYSDTMYLFESFFNNIQVPTISAMSTLQPYIAHFESAMACDIALCSDTMVFGDIHFSTLSYLAGMNGERCGIGMPAGDGQALALEQLIGNRRTAYLVYTGATIDAQTALEWGIVNEVLPLEQLLPRCQEIAHDIIAAAPPIARRLQSQLIKRPWKQKMANDLQNHLTHEIVAMVKR